MQRSSSISAGPLTPLAQRGGITAPLPVDVSAANNYLLIFSSPTNVRSMLCLFNCLCSLQNVAKWNFPKWIPYGWCWTKKWRISKIWSNPAAVIVMKLYAPKRISPNWTTNWSRCVARWVPCDAIRQTHATPTNSRSVRFIYFPNIFFCCRFVLLEFFTIFLTICLCVW